MDHRDDPIQPVQTGGKLRVEIFHGFDSVENEPTSSVTVGSFDGLHLGHQRIFRLMRKGGAGPVTVVTFNPHPMKVIRPNRTQSSLLTTFEERIELFSTLKVDRLIIIPFDKEFAKIKAKQFVEDILCDTVGMTRIYTGPRHNFGAGGEGDIDLLRKIGENREFDVEVVEAVSRWGQKISSHHTRQVLLEGDVLSAWRFLNRPFYINGKVIKGDGRGQKFGVPTANLTTDNCGKINLPGGVYATIAELGGFRYPSVSHFGKRPMFPNATPSIETHIIGFDRDIYGKKIKIGLIDRLRDSGRFPSVEELVRQLHQDRKDAIRRLAELGFDQDARLRQQRYGKMD
ncbi:MAG: bifunctional riboflavin kinase/FAD synthetase [Candidatus Electryoneaceae bacterium]|nr:bifunctional riboflavin kinase/FAD synthetase [Candidatus Electryoneaceae bacterium]